MPDLLINVVLCVLCKIFEFFVTFIKKSIITKKGIWDVKLLRSSILCMYINAILFEVSYLQKISDAVFILSKNIGVAFESFSYFYFMAFLNAFSGRK